MAHFVTIENTAGELVDLEVYCSDSCAQTSTFYAGWYGCMEVEFDTQCVRCSSTVHGALGAYQD